MNIVDVRTSLPRHPTAKFATRRRSDIRGVVFHQALGGGDVRAIAGYHTSPECHLAPGKGAPGICYTFYVGTDGTVYRCHDYEVVTWSQGGGQSPVEGTRGNHNFLAVCFQGDFPGEGWAGKADPSPEQLAVAAELWHHLRLELNLEPRALFGHHDFGKPACPGVKLKALIEKIRTEPDVLAPLTPHTVEGWQRALVLLGASIEVDGDWGPKSHAALVAFQSSQGMPRTGQHDPLTAAKVAHALRDKGLQLAPKSEVKLEGKASKSAAKKGEQTKEG